MPKGRWGNRRKGQGAGESKNSPQIVQCRLRAEEAVELRARNLTYAQIAEQLGYADAATAYNAIKAYWVRHPREDVEHLREQEMRRLDMLQAPIWERATSGKDDAAAALALKISKRRSELTGMDAPARAPVNALGESVVPIINVIYESSDGHPLAEAAPGPAASDQ